MPKFVLMYQLEGPSAMGDMNNWMKWYKDNQESFVSNMPFEEGACEITQDSQEDFKVSDSSPLIRAMDIIQADNLDSAKELVKTCPLLEANGKVVVYEVKDMKG